MMVPRAFLFSSVPSANPLQRKGQQMRPSVDAAAVQPDDSMFQLSTEKTSPTHTHPVVIPPKRGPRMASPHTDSARNETKPPRRSRASHRLSSASPNDRPLPTSIASILEATAIPVPRRNRTARESRKLPRGNHVQDFSRLLLDGVDDHLLEGTGNTTLDVLLSPPEENEKLLLGSDCDSEILSFSARSMSISSIPSLDNDLETPSSLPLPATPSSQRSPFERRYRRASHPVNCALNHPLLETESSEFVNEPEIASGRPSPVHTVPTPKPLISTRSFPRLGAFKSNLTASLRAIKTAAQSVSTFASPSVQPDDFLTRSLFTITPEMTDDRRPPPMNEPPSPALRRYLNPIVVSPAEMYTYQDQPHENIDNGSCPISVQMQTYNRSGRRGPRRSNFHFSESKGRGRQFLPFDPEIPPMSRQREPRENSDFLRMVVLEMNMRRRGKLRDDIPTRARVWLPPRRGNQPRFTPYDFEDDDDENAIPSRWVGISVESF